VLPKLCIDIDWAKASEDEALYKLSALH
jgi:hypothetical protein